MRPGKGAVPMRYSVARSRDGRSFADRRVTVVQEGATLFEAVVSYGHAFDGLAYAPPMLEVPAADELPELPPPPFARQWSLEERVRRMGLDMAYVVRRGIWGELSARVPPPPFRTWHRPCAPLPEDPLIHAAAMAWLSDGPIIGVVGGQLQLPETPGRGATLNQSIWWHAPPRWDGWLLYACEAHAAFADRGLQLGRMYAEDGTLLASVAQETLFPTRV
jgi:acyl-CoA thioesterase II